MKTITAQVSKISTTADQCVRLVLDVDKDSAPDDIFKWLFDTVLVSKDERED
jgi:hypothetical protein